MSASSGVVLVGPYPPPHGGVSVHVECLRRKLERTGIPVVVVNAVPGAPTSNEYVRIGGAAGLLRHVASYGCRGWMLHAHINGHNTKSWLLAALSAAGALAAPRRMLTVHSGMVPDYLRQGGWRSVLVRVVCRAFDRVVCVSEEIRLQLAEAGVTPERLFVLPAYLSAKPRAGRLPDTLAAWLEDRSPILATTLAFEPEYRFDLLARALSGLRSRYPSAGCLVMGSGRGEEAARRLIEDLDLEDSVLLLGDVDHDTCLRLLAHADLYVRPTDRDGDAISVREALDLGTPVVASDAALRPPGATVFPTGDLPALQRAIVETLSETTRLSHPAHIPGGGSLDALYGPS